MKETRCVMLKLFVFVWVVLVKTCVECIELNELSERTDAMLGNKPRDKIVDRHSWVWRDYEIGTGYGNREEILIKNIKIAQNVEFPEDIEDWQCLKNNDRIYLAGTRNSNLFLYDFDIHNDHVSLRASVYVQNETINSFEIFNILSNVDTANEKEEIHLVLSVKSNNNIQSLKWFKLLDSTFHQFWIWNNLDRAIKRSKYFQFNGQHKLAVLYEPIIYFKEAKTLIKIYDVKIDGNFSKYWLCDEIYGTEITDLEICQTEGNSVTVSLLSKNHVVLYEHKAENIVKCIFKEVRNITANGLINTICFESGYIPYFLVTSNSESSLFNIYNNEYVYDKKMEQFFKNIGSVRFIQNLPVDTYREEVIPIVQLKNSTLLFLGWRGSENFIQIPTLDMRLNDFDLSTATIIPNYGFLSKNIFVKIDVKLKESPRPQQQEIEKLLNAKSILEDVLEKQELIINMTSEVQNHLYSFKGTELPELSEIQIEDLVIDKIDTVPVKLNSQNLTLRDIQSSYEKVLDLMYNIETSLDKTEKTLTTNKRKIMNTTNFFEIDIIDDLDIKGTLTVENLVIDNFNGVSMDALMKDCLRDNNTKISGIKLFPTIKLTSDNLKIKNLNGVPFKNIDFHKENNISYDNFDWSKITKLEVRKNLNFSKISGRDWHGLIRNVVLKNEKAVINGSTTISQINANLVKIDYLNNIEYPSGYIVISGPEDADMTSAKTFETLKVTELRGVETINDIDADEFIILNADQHLKRRIIFKNLVIEENLQIDGNIVDLKQDIDPNLTLLNSNKVQSNAEFTNLYVSGNVYVESLYESGWDRLDDLVLKDEENVRITGKKTFLNTVNIADNFEVRKEMLNGRSMITLDTRQVLPNLSNISGNLKFMEVSYEELKSLEESLSSVVDDEIVHTCETKQIVFTEAPVVDEFSSSRINENITSADFFEKLRSLMGNVHFENLLVKTLVVKDLIPTTVNGVNFEEFREKKITKSSYQDLSGNVTVNYLEVDKLYADLVNGRSFSDLEDGINKINNIFPDIFDENKLVHSLNITGTIIASKLNSKDLNDIFDVDYIKQLVFKNDKTIENIQIDGLINGVNFTEKVNDTILKNEDNIIVKSTKKLKKLKSNHLHVNFINGHAVEDIINSDKNQTLTGTVKIKGSAIIVSNFKSNGKINNILFQDLSEVIHKLDSKIYKLSGDFIFGNRTSIKNLDVFGQLQHEDMPDFLENIVFFNEKNVTIEGTKIFNSPINFSDKITITKNLNHIDLQKFYRSAILIDRPMLINSSVIFNTDVLVEQNLNVFSDLKVGTIKSVNINDLMDSAAYLNRPTSISDTISLSDVIFESNIIVKSWNNVKIDSFFILNTDEVMRNILKCVDVTVENLEIKGSTNGENLTDIYENTFMLSTDQKITGKMTFFNNVHVWNNFDSKFINSIDISKTISLRDSDPITGKIVFNSPVVMEGDLNINRNLNDVDFRRWQQNTITTNSLTKQTIFGNWTVYGNVHIEKNVNGSGPINGIDVQHLVRNIEDRNKNFEAMISKKLNDTRKVCRSLQQLKYKAENMPYRFNSFEFFDILLFDKEIQSFHHFEMNDTNYIMINFDECSLLVYKFTNQGFVPAIDIPNFGSVKEFITLNFENNLYFTTIGNSECDKSSGNLWSFQDNKFKLVLDLGNVSALKQIGNDEFVIVVDQEVQEWSIERINKNILEPVNVFPIKERKLEFFSFENETLLASLDTIYDLQDDIRSNILSFFEYENIFNTNSIMTFRVGIDKKEYVLTHQEDYIFICESNLYERKVLQAIKSQNPSSFLVLNFDKYEENFLIFSENRRTIQIYEYKGIEYFKYHSSIKMKNEKLFSFEMRMHPHFAKSHFLAVVKNDRLTILQAKMYGERLDMKDQLSCTTFEGQK